MVRQNDTLKYADACQLLVDTTNWVCIGGLFFYPFQLR